MRANAGRPYTAFVIERLVDLVARNLKLDTAEVRRLNFVRADQMPYATGMLNRDGSSITYDSATDIQILIRKGYLEPDQSESSEALRGAVSDLLFELSTYST